MLWVTVMQRWNQSDQREKIEKCCRIRFVLNLKRLLQSFMNLSNLEVLRSATVLYIHLHRVYTVGLRIATVI